MRLKFTTQKEEVHERWKIFQQYKQLKKQGKTNNNKRYRYCLQNLLIAPIFMEFLRNDGERGTHQCENFLSRMPDFYDYRFDEKTKRWNWWFIPQNKLLDDAWIDKCPICGMTPEEMNDLIFPSAEELEEFDVE